MARDTLLGFPSHSLPYRYRAAVPPPSGGAGGALNPGQGQPPGGGGGDMLTRPARTPGRAYSVGANARRGGAPCPTAYNIRRWSLPHYGEQAATPTPQKTAWRPCERRPCLAAEYQMRLVLARGWGPRPAQTRARRGGREAEGRFGSPAPNTAREGGDPPGAPLVCSRFIRAGIRRKKRPRRAITRDSIPPLVLRRGPPHIPRRLAPCRPLPWRVGGAAPPM